MLTIAFWHIGVQIDGDAVEAKPLGGTESAMIYAARALARRGHRVTVYTETESIHESHAVRYCPIAHCESELLAQPPDILICVRQILPLLALPARFKVYFSPDACDQPFVNRAFTVQVECDGFDLEMGLYSLAYAQRFCDAIFCVGQWQMETFRDRFHIPSGKLFIAGNGVDAALFAESAPLAGRRRSVAYASTPFRGLDHLLRLFPRIRQRVPDAMCDVYSGMQLYGESDAEDRKTYGHLYALADQPGVELHGPVNKRQLMQELNQCRLLAYPNTFAETFCIAVLEAQAAGLPVVTSSLAALKERVTPGENGFLIAGKPGTSEYDDAFVEHCVQLLQDDELCERQGRSAFLTSRFFSYEHLAERWEEYFDRAQIRERSATIAAVDVQPQRAAVLVNGYSRQVELSDRIICQTMAGYLRGLSLPRAAERLVRLGGK